MSHTYGVERNLSQRARDRVTRGAKYKRYAHTKRGFLVRVYRNMKIRVQGRDKRKKHLYVGLEIVPKYEFYEWACNSAEFNDLYDVWVRAGFDKSKTPVLRRIIPELGYTVDNLEWMENSTSRSS